MFLIRESNYVRFTSEFKFAVLVYCTRKLITYTYQELYPLTPPGWPGGIVQ